MLQIRLNKGTSSESGGGAKLSPRETVTVACPEHLVLSELPVAKSLGSAIGVSLVKTVGRKSRCQLGERVHFCVRCDLPIAVYGRLTPCEHAFCLDCARSGSICYICDERIQKIQTIKMMEGIFVCGATHCLKSFLKKSEFMVHVRATHADLLNPNTQKDGNESEAQSGKKPTASDSTVQAPPRPVFSPNSNSQVHNCEDKAENNRPPGFDGPGPMNHFPQQSFNSPGGLQQGIPSETSYPEYPMIPYQPPNFALPSNSSLVLAPPPFSYHPFAPDGSQQLYVSPSAPEAGTEKALLGFPPGGPVGMNFAESYPRPFNIGHSGVPFESSLMGNQGIGDNIRNMSDSQGRVEFFQGSNLPHPLLNEVMESVQGGNAMDSRDGKGLLVPQPHPPTQPAPP